MAKNIKDVEPVANCDQLSKAVTNRDRFVETRNQPSKVVAYSDDLHSEIAICDIQFGSSDGKNAYANGNKVPNVPPLRFPEFTGEWMQT
ncbi:MAG: hypothetical protein J1E33_07550, partial [Alistipes sp.]|nr:hypothetical protein [Alistipes sp.]